MYVRASDPETTYRAFIGFGNNSNLIKSILKRRYWWTIVDKSEGCHFVWSQLKINTIFRESQSSSQNKVDQIYYKELEVADKMRTEPIARLQEGHDRIFNEADLVNWNRHMRKYRKTEISIN